MNTDNDVKKNHDVKYSKLTECDSDDGDLKKWAKGHGITYSCGSDKKKSSQNFSLMSSGAVTCVMLWYFFSFTTLFLNKFILSYEHGDPTILGNLYLIMLFIGIFDIIFVKYIYFLIIK